MSPDSRPRGGTLRRVHLLIRSNWISSGGAALATIAFLATITGGVLQTAGIWVGPYTGILTVVVFPALFVLGLVMVPVGLLIYRKYLKARLDALADKPLYLARAVAILTVINFAGIAAIGYTGVEYMGSVEFCGTACHSAMDPEWVNYQTSPHAHVSCVACHVGPGAEAFIASKINGAKQLLGYVMDDYRKPIPTPVEHLRPASETCYNCHWPEKYLGTKLLVRPHYRDNKAASAYINVLLMRTGGVRKDGENVGIHWHTNPDVEVDYIATDERREKIAWVRVRDRDGTERVYTAEGVDPENPPEGERRRMDCNDCHNRAAHAFERPELAVDEAISAGLISRRLPFIKKFAVEALTGEYTRDDAEDGIRQAMLDKYNADGMLDADSRPLLEPAVQELAKIWKRNVYPDRKLFWNTYPDFKTHAGCFRCHEDKEEPRTGVQIPTKCDTCHSVLSNEEEDPAILEALGLGR